MIKKYLTGAILALVLLVVGGAAAGAEEFHKGEQPLRTYVSEETGIVVDVFAADPKDAETIKKERGWAKHEVEKIKNPVAIEATTKDKVASAFYSILGNTTTALIENFGTIKALAGTDTAGWDLVGTEYWVMNGLFDSIQRDTTWHSHGGDYMFNMPAHSASVVSSMSPYAGYNPHMGVSLYEYDPGVQDTFVTSWHVYPSSAASDYVVRNVNAFVDFGEAEFFTTHRSNYKTSTGRIDNVRYYD